MNVGFRFDPAALLLHSTLVLAFGLIAPALLRRFGPSVRVAALRATLVGLLAIAALGLLDIERVVAPAMQVAVPAQVVVPMATVRRVAPRAFLPKLSTPETLAPPPAVPIDWRPWAVGLWATGAVLLGLRMLMGHLALARLRRRALPADPRTVAALRDVAGDRAPDVVIADVASPFIAGVFRSTLYLHPDAEKADDTTLRAILSHEAVHHRQRDCAWRTLSTLASALLWPQPLAWLLARQLETAAEEACDAAVVRDGASRTAYAACLLALAERPSLRRAERAFGAGVMPNRSHVGRRVAAILSGKAADLGPASRRARYALGGLMLAVAAGATMLVTTRTPSGTYTDDSDPKAVAAYERMLASVRDAQSLSFTVEQGAPGTMKKTYTVAYEAPNRARIVVMKYDSLVPAAKRYLQGDRIVIEAGDSKTYREFRRLTPSEEQMRREWGPENWPAPISGLRMLMQSEVQDEILGLIAEGEKKGLRAPGFARRVTFDAKRRIAVETILPPPYGSRQRTRTFYALGPDSLPILVRQEITFDGGGENVTESRYFDLRRNPRLTDADLAFRPKPGAVLVKDESRQVATPEAKAILAAMRTSYAGLKSLSFVVQGPKATMDAHLARPNRARLEVRYDDYPRQNLTLVADGRQMLVDNAEYSDRVLLAPATPEGISNLGGSGLAMNLSDAMSYLQLAMVDNPPHMEGMPFRLVGQAQANGALCDVLESKSPFSDEAGFLQAGTYHLERLYIGHADHLVRRLEHENKFTNAPDIRRDRLDFQNLVANGPINESTFRFTVPSNKRTFDSASAFRETSPRVQDDELVPAIGGPAPRVVTTTLDGKRFDLKSLRGKTVILHAWTYGVTNQREDLPIYERMQRQYGAKGLVVVGIPCEDLDWKPNLLADLKKRRILTTQLWDGKGRAAGGLQRTLGLSHFPYSLLILPDGRVFARDFFGKEIEKTVKAAMAR